MQEVVLVVPCYNEEKRLNLAAFSSWNPGRDIQVLFVDDGSIDQTAKQLQEFCSRSPDERFGLHRLGRNQGKAEAVRQGMLAAIQKGARVTGYLDADLATPLSEASRLIETLQENSHLDCVMGSRVQILGHQVERSPLRHYLGRVFATFASLILRIPIYDTQCGAKVFRVTESLKKSLESPFHSRWIFDVELIDRLLASTGAPRSRAVRRFAEVPLRAWQDVSGSKLRFYHMGSAVTELLWIALHPSFKKQRSERETS